MILRAAASLVVAAMVPASAPVAAADRPRHLSSLQTRIDAAAPGATLEIGPGTYDGDLVVDKPLRIVGIGRPLLRGSGDGTVVSITAPGVTFTGFDIDGRAGGDLGRDASGIHIAAPRAVIVDCAIENALFGIYLRQAHAAHVERCRIRGIKEKAAGEKGSGIHVWDTDGFTLQDNEIVDVRDGIYIQSSPHGVVRRNVARDLRYGLHYMYSDDNLFEDNVFENGDAGTAIMYSRRLTFRRNQFLHNRGFASVGLLLKTCDDVLAEHNTIADNARGVFLEGSQRVLVRENVIAESDIAILLFSSTEASAFTGNSFVANLTPLSLVGRRTDTRFSGNYWSDHDAPDLDGDGIADGPYRLSSVFDHFRGNLTAADLFSRSLSVSALALAERAMPALDPLPLFDNRPLARPPSLATPPIWRDAAAPSAPVGLALSACAACAGGLVLALRGRPRKSRAERAA